MFLCILIVIVIKGLTPATWGGGATEGQASGSPHRQKLRLLSLTLGLFFYIGMSTVTSRLSLGRWRPAYTLSQGKHNLLTGLL